MAKQARTRAQAKGRPHQRGSKKQISRSASPKRRSAPAQRSKAAVTARPARSVPSARTIAIVVIAVAVLAALGWHGYTVSKQTAQWKHDHKWQSTVQRAEDYFGIDRDFTDCMLTILQVESSGDEDIDERHDIAQAWEGDGSKYMRKGLKSEGVEPYTVEASIYAGVCELSLCIRDFQEYLGYSPDPTDLNDLALLAQGYNYGHLGWFAWLRDEGISEWSLEVSKRYQKRIDGLGTAIHGQKIMDTYLRVSKKS